MKTIRITMQFTAEIDDNIDAESVVVATDIRKAMLYDGETNAPIRGEITEIIHIETQ